MSKFRAVQEADQEWNQIRPNVEKLVFHEGGENEPELFEVRVGPTFETPQHAHTEDEIIFILDGSMRIGAKEYDAHSAILVPGDQLYRFKAGEQGCRFLNFRPSRAGTIFKEEFLARRAERRSGSGPSPSEPD